MLVSTEINRKKRTSVMLMMELKAAFAEWKVITLQRGRSNNVHGEEANTNVRLFENILKNNLKQFLIFLKDFNNKDKMDMIVL